MYAFILLAFSLALIAMAVLFLLTQQKTFEAISSENRLMQAGNV